MKIGIVSAMNEEIDKLINESKSLTKNPYGGRLYYEGPLWDIDSVLVFSRWGKVAAATTITHLIDNYNIDKIIFTGVAGGIDKKINIGDIVIAKELIQHDMDARPLFERYEIPLLGIRALKTDSYLNDKLLKASKKFLEEDIKSCIQEELLKEFNLSNPKIIEAQIVSGDKFFSNKDEIKELKSRFPQAVCVEMEGAAVAQVCYEHKMPFSVIRTISDSADEKAQIDFMKFLKNIASTYSFEILKNTYSILNS